MENIKNERKLRLTGVNFRRFLAGTAAGVTLMAMSGCAKKNDKVVIPENTIGYYDTLDKVDENNFVIFDIQNSKEISPKEFTDLKEKITKAKNQGISVGIKLELSTKELQVYNDIDYIKTLIKEYGNEFIDFPVYVGIDSIVESDLSLKEKFDLITKILTILEENGMYVGLYGKDSNLCKLREGILLNYKDYDSCVVMESKQPEDIKYDGSFNLYMDKKGVINSKADYDLSDIIVNNYKNKKENLKGNLVYEVQEGDKLKDIAEKYEISTKTILKYNNISKFKFKKGLKLEIPSEPTEVDQKYIKGGDISVWDVHANGNKAYIDWDRVENDYKFVMLRTNYGDMDGEVERTAFEDWYYEVTTRNIPFGIYMMNGFYSPEDEPVFENGKENNLENFKEMVNRECDLMFERIKDKNISLGEVYLDLENEGGYFISNFSKEYLVELLSIFYDRVCSYEDQKLIPGIYFNNDVQKTVVSILETETDNKELDERAQKLLEYYLKHIWKAGGIQYGNEENPPDDIEYTDVKVEEDIFEENPDLVISQPVNVAIHAPVSDGHLAGHADIDFRISPVEDVEIRIFEPKNNNSILPVVIIVILIGGVVVGTKVIKKKDLPKFRKDHPEIEETPVLTEDEFKQELESFRDIYEKCKK